MSGRALKARLSDVPHKPGIYFFKNARREIIYIGKARSLRDRMRSYFQSRADSKVRAILDETTDMDYILTGSEKEAAFLENNYVQRHQPRYNLRLKDDKSFPYIKVTLSRPFPAISFCRRVEKDSARYFGPYAPAHRARQVLRLVNRFFGLRSCEESVFRNRKRPCLEYDLGLCSAPCTGLITEDRYAENVRQAILFLERRSGKLLPELRSNMSRAAERQEFEAAARWRDLIRAVEDMGHRPGVISTGRENRDIIGFSRRGEVAVVQVFFMRRGKVSDSEQVMLGARPRTSDAELLARFLEDFYAGGRPLPDSILLPLRPSRPDMLEKALGRLRGRTVRIIVPKRAGSRSLVELAGRNADKVLTERARLRIPSALSELQRSLGLKTMPRSIEGFDISNTGGTETVGSSVSFLDGRPRKDGYRKFKVRTVRGSNDVAGLKEIVGRRLARLKEGSAREGGLPDLILVDGGLGQIHAARQALTGLGLDHLPVVSLAKKNESVFTADRREGLNLPRTSAALKLLQHIRDEAHRFAVSFHRRRRSGASFSSFLDGVPGLGCVKKTKLLAEFKDIGRVKGLGLEELSERIGARAAAALRSKIGSEEAEDDRRRRD